ncbi:MAPEG family protein [Sphingomonas antarctica]|uniref:MAPEG family protein n=1 Tax=Sphingomonas antarctica TaxID=2040274 RepID=UPI0039ED586F
MPLNSAAHSMIGAIFGMGVLTLAMMLWMSVARLPAMKAEGLTLQDAAHTDVLRSRLPSTVTRIADNFRHLFETPTIFYAISLAIVVVGLADPLHALCAWLFLACRVLHSIVQATMNIVSVRATLYMLSWLALATMIVRAAIAAVA